MIKLNIIAIIAILLALIVFNASAGCGRWVVRDDTDYLADPTFDMLASSWKDYNASESGAEDNSVTKARDVSPFINNSLADKGAALNISGRWLVEFGDGQNPLNLILFQSGRRILGYGSVKENGNEIPATAIGSVSGDAISLDVKLAIDGTINIMDKRHKLELVNSDGALSGTYEVYLADKLAGKGNALATRS